MRQRGTETFWKDSVLPLEWKQVEEHWCRSHKDQGRMGGDPSFTFLVMPWNKKEHFSFGLGSLHRLISPSDKTIESHIQILAALSPVFPHKPKGYAAVKLQALLSMFNQLSLPDFQSLVASSVPSLYKNAASSMPGVPRTSSGPQAHLKEENTYGGSKHRKQFVNWPPLISLLGSLLNATGLGEHNSPLDWLFHCQSWRYDLGHTAAKVHD